MNSPQGKVSQRLAALGHTVADAGFGEDAGRVVPIFTQLATELGDDGAYGPDLAAAPVGPQLLQLLRWRHVLQGDDNGFHLPEVSNDVHELARRIYRKHKRAIDLIIEHRERYEPNYVTEWFRMARDAIGGQPVWREAQCNHPYARFVSAEWERFDELKLNDWSYSLLLFEIHATPGGAELYLSLAQGGDEQLRQKIFDTAKANLGVFECVVPAYTDGFIRLHTVGMILHEGDSEFWWDEAGTSQTINARLEDFARCRFTAIDEIIVDCLDDYRTSVE